MRTASAPNTLAAGPTIRKESGAPAIEIIQSRLETRPRRSEGTSRWSIVNHSTTRSAMAPSATKATTMACHTAVTNPKPAVRSIPSAQARYIKVIGRRGSDPRCAMKTPTATLATPPTEHQRQVEAGAVEVIAHDERDERLPRPPDAQQAHRGSQERHEDPGLAPDVPDSFHDVVRDVLVRCAVVAGRPNRHEPDADGGHGEREGVGEEGHAHAERDEDASQQRADDHHRDGPHDLADGVGFHQEVFRNDGGDDRQEGGTEQRLPHAEDRHERHEDGNGEGAFEREQTDRTDRREADHVAGDHQVSPVHAIGERTRREQQQQLRERPRDADRGERGRRRVHLPVDLPGHRDHIDAVADQRDRHAGPEEPEIADPERTEDPDAIDDGRAFAHGR